MSQPGDIRQAAADALSQVDRLRTKGTSSGAISPPAAVIQHGRIVTDITLGGSVDYVLRVILLVQLGSIRTGQQAVETLIDPSGTVYTSAITALQSDARFGAIVCDDIGDIDYGGTTYAGAILSVEAIA